MPFLNYLGNKFFDEDDLGYNAIPRSRAEFDTVNPNIYPLSIDMIDVADDHYVVIADVPGVSKDRLTITVKDDMIMIEGKRKKKVITDEDTYLINERRNGLIKKMIRAPKDADLDDMKAKVEDGLLVLTIPRVKSVNGAKYISIMFHVFLLTNIRNGLNNLL